MCTSSKSICQYQDWWGNRKSRVGGGSSRRANDGVFQLPLPSFPPVLDFDSSQFALPPAYEKVFDIEKALRPAQLSHRHSTNIPTIHQETCLEKLHRSSSETDRHSFLLPVRRHVRVLRCLRYTVFTVYQRLFTFVFTINLIGVFILSRRHRSRDIEDKQICKTVSTLASSNFLLAILIRQDYLVNLFFRTAWLVPWSVPLCIRKIVARVYCYGGVHSGAAVAGTVWWVVFTVMTSWMFLKEASPFSITVIAWILLLLLLTVLGLSFPALRARYHNTFEMTHRFLGWLSIALFWVQLLLLTAHTTPSLRHICTELIHDPTFWNLTIMTLLLIYPWLRLRRWTFTAHVLSSHAIRLSFTNPIHRFSCLSISSSPLCEWHPFATFPSSPISTSMVISNAGDWTREIIRFAQSQTQSQQQQHQLQQQQNRSTTTQPPSEKDEGVTLSFYTKSHPKAGVLSLSLLYPRILILTTGSGIGPALSSLLERPAAQHARLIWSTRSPLATYGQDIMNLVHQADKDAVILDTDEMGRPDLLEVAWDMARREEVDAVFVLSNEKVVRWIVGGLERRGVLAYGPIWDS
jgi:hypothetical protein